MTVRIGLVVPCDLTLDREYWDLAPDDVSIHITRTGFHDGGLTLEFVRGVSDLGELAYATRSLSKIEPVVIGYACTSGSFIKGLVGEATIRDTMLANGAPSAVTTSGAMLEALRHLGVRRVGLGTPYALEIAEFLPPFVRDAVSNRCRSPTSSSPMSWTTSPPTPFASWRPSPTDPRPRRSSLRAPVSRRSGSSPS